MLLPLFLLSDSFVTVIVDRNEAKSKTNKNPFKISFKPAWHKMKTWSYLELNNFQLTYFSLMSHFHTP